MTSRVAVAFMRTSSPRQQSPEAQASPPSAGPEIVLDLSRLLSRMLHPLPAQLPPFCVSYGDAESSEFRRQSIDFAGRLTRHGHTADLLPLAGENHFDAVFGLADPASILTRHVVASAMLPVSAK